MRKTSLASTLWLLAFMAAGLNLRAPIVAVGPLLETIMAELSLGAGRASLLATGMVICFGLLSPLAPWVATRLGLDLTLTLCLAAIAAGGLLRSIDPFGVMLLGTLLTGAGIAFANVLMPSLIKRDRPQRMGATMGLYTVVMGIGGTTAAITAVPLMEASGSWWLPLRLWSGVAAAACLLWSWQLWQRPAAPIERSRVQLTTLLGNGSAWLLTLFMGIQSLGFYTVQAWLVAVAMEAGMPHGRAGVMLSVVNLLSIPAGYAAARLAARLPRQRALAVGLTALIAIAILGLLLAPLRWPLLWAALLGIGQGGSFSLALTLIVLRTREPDHAATLSAMVQSIGYSLAAVGPWLFGMLYSLSGGWRLSLLVLLGLVTIQLVLGWGIGSGAAIVPRRRPPRDSAG